MAEPRAGKPVGEDPAISLAPPPAARCCRAPALRCLAVREGSGSSAGVRAVPIVDGMTMLPASARIARGRGRTTWALALTALAVGVW
eukprot:1140217-Alexandrium_andersonii.AAC.1